MSIIGNAGKMVGGVFTGVGKILTPPKKPNVASKNDFLHESTDDYAKRLMQRRSDRH